MKKLYRIGWCLSTAVYGDDIQDWDVVNDSIMNFESMYKSILSPYVISCENHGHDSNGDLVGSAIVIDSQIKEIQDNFEFTVGEEYTLTSSSGNFSCDELDVLDDDVFASLTFDFGGIERLDDVN